MKTFKVIAKIVVALAAIAGVVYVVATYGDRIVAWARGLLNRCDCCCDCDCECDCEECDCEDDCEECTCGCACEETEEAAVTAEQADFEG